MGGFTVAMIQKHSDKLAVAGDGDHSWTVLEVPDRRLVDVAFHNGRVFVLADDGTAVVCDLAGGTSSLPAVTCAVSLSLEVGVLRQDAVVGNYYLVGSSTGGLLMMLRRSWRGRVRFISERYQTEKIEAFVLDDGGEKWRKVENLGGTALFVGDNFSSFCVKGSPEFGRNCIYVSDLIVTHSVGVFDMDSGKMDICRHVKNERKIWWSGRPSGLCHLCSRTVNNDLCVFRTAGGLV
uniref:F-box protein SKIP23 n=1 Tax=Anthurium amnicola TaxID=1678845 RepID=A0A1D1XF33_9ARAE